MKIPISAKDPLKQPLSWVIAVMGGLSLFNLVRNLGLVAVSAPIAFLDQIYADLRDLIFLPLEAVTQVTWAVWLKNLLVIYVVFARAYSSSIAFLKKELATPPDSDRLFRRTSKSYPPLEKGPIHRKMVWVDAVLSRLPAQGMRSIARSGFMVIASVFWPVGVLSLMRNPTLTIETVGAERVGTPHPTNPNEVELPPLNEQGGFQYSPKFPAEGDLTQPIYSARIIFLTFMSIQILLALLMITVNALLPAPEAPPAQSAITEVISSEPK